MTSFVRACSNLEGVKNRGLSVKGGRGSFFHWYFGYRTGIIIIFIPNDNEQGFYHKNGSKTESD